MELLDLDLHRDFNGARRHAGGKPHEGVGRLRAFRHRKARAMSRDDLVCLTGSFYLVGDTLKHLAQLDRARGGKISAVLK